MLAEAVRHIGNVRVRHRGTIGGSLAHAEATAELATVAVAQRATVRVLGPRGERTLPAAELFVTHLTTSLAPGEVLTGVEFPAAEASRVGELLSGDRPARGRLRDGRGGGYGVGRPGGGAATMSGWWSVRWPTGRPTYPTPRGP